MEYITRKLNFIMKKRGRYLNKEEFEINGYNCYCEVTTNELTQTVALGIGLRGEGKTLEEVKEFVSKLKVKFTIAANIIDNECINIRDNIFIADFPVTFTKTAFIRIEYYLHLKTPFLLREKLQDFKDILYLVLT